MLVRHMNKIFVKYLQWIVCLGFMVWKILQVSFRKIDLEQTSLSYKTLKLSSVCTKDSWYTQFSTFVSAHVLKAITISNTLKSLPDTICDRERCISCVYSLHTRFPFNKVQSKLYWLLDWYMISYDSIKHWPFVSYKQKLQRNNVLLSVIGSQRILLIFEIKKQLI